jgi:hypothetical protein
MMRIEMARRVSEPWKRLGRERAQKAQRVKKQDTGPVAISPPEVELHAPASGM